MKNLKYIFTLFIISSSFTACSTDEDTVVEPNPVEDLFKIEEFTAEDYAVELYSTNSDLQVGYNELAVRIKDLGNKEYLSDADVSWIPVMHMTSKEHSAPHSELQNSGNSVYTGNMVFQMPGNESEYWDLQLNFDLNGKKISQALEISVSPSQDGLKKVQVFVGNDNNKYILAYVKPEAPKMGINDFQAVLYKMQDLMTFPVVENAVIELDPRMPGMDNHSSPNNQDLVYNTASKRYEGKLSLTMTGYWRINLKLIDAIGEVIKGQDVSESNPESDLYFELEF